MSLGSEVEELQDEWHQEVTNQLNLAQQQIAHEARCQYCGMDPGEM